MKPVEALPTKKPILEITERIFQGPTITAAIEQMRIDAAESHGECSDVSIS
jgi:hypothetical protein